jgi:3-hydroxyisobutyrate dehydrogenase-like beta-hydroxyacid dehydrogenase
MDKDIRLALELGRELDVPLASARAADEALTKAAELGYESKDIAALFQVLGTDGEPSKEARRSKAT